MCWSGEASAAVTLVGVSCTAYLAYKKESPMLWVPLLYFTLMEALQAYTYSVIDKCGLPENQIATMLGYLHITFQPFFVNAFSLYFLPAAIRKKVAPAAYTVCFVAAIMMLLKLYPFAWSPMCTPGVRPMCGSVICAFHGSWHIAWQLPINTFVDYIPFYLIAAFIFPALYGSWKFTLFHLITGPLLARATTSDLNEWPAVWCLFSLEVMLIAMSSRLRDRLHVKKWPFWGKIQ
ncbi:MAG: hypothetical protein EBR02_02410 [Alphaproteobacteria bacterium]|nr:hypothetical protein [Alphaproteobacteria bacterium]